MTSIIEVCEKWKKDTSISRESSDLFDADEMIDEFGEKIPIFFFQFAWKDNKSFMHLHIRCGMLPTNSIICVDSLEQLNKYIEMYNLNNYTFHQHAIASNLCKWWSDCLTSTEISEIKQKREKKIEQLIKNVVSDIRSNHKHLISY